MIGIRVREAPQAIGGGESFKAGDLSGIAWLPDSPLYPIARRIESMPDDERESLLLAIKQSKEMSSEGLRYLVSSYGVPIAWATHDGNLYRTRLRHSDATSKHIELAVAGLQVLLDRDRAAGQ